ncbi:MAG: prepilin peptidase [Pseudomonadota bacterium]
MSEVRSELFGADRIARQPWFGYEAELPRFSKADQAAQALTAGAFAGWTRTRGLMSRRIVPAVDRAGEGLEKLSDRELIAEARVAGFRARRGDPASLNLVAPLFALVREVASRRLGMRHYPVQLRGGYVMMCGQLAEMQTGEGKTLTATLAAGAMALAGRPVHVVTVNDYLASRDSEEMKAVYEGLGLSVGLIAEGMSPEDRTRAYAADVAYCTNKELAFDYLKDRIDPKTGDGRLTRRVRGAYSRDGEVPRGMLRGLAFALIDEADSVLIDEARTPLILSGEGPPLFDPDLLRRADELARRLTQGDYRVFERERRIELTPRGVRRLDEANVDGALANRAVREDLVVKALTAERLFLRGEHYLVRDGKVEIIDEYTGRVMADRFWVDGLHQMVERKEGLEPSKGRVTLARTTYQRFFRRYDRIGGMSGTIREVAPEIWRSYGVAVATIPTRRKVLRVKKRARIFAREAEKLSAIEATTRTLNGEGAPVLIGTRTVASSNQVSAALEATGLAHRLLSAEFSEEEARIIAEAGQRGQVTIATNMAGRGADISLDAPSRDRGGLHVIMSEPHDSGRIDRQLAGRAGRQGDPGFFQPYLALDDPLLEQYGVAWPRLLAQWIAPLRGPLGRFAFSQAQRRAERLHSRMRRDLSKQDDVLNDAMSFSGARD